ncbi:2-alkenal reductase, partial [Candidatus Uhrbacteria bacterium CG22_combo_CG10-13_8_21_14_all_47_17]
SGGPLLDLNGKVVGINTAISDGAQSLGFALPSNVLQRASESVQKYGRIVRPWIGVRYIFLDQNYADAHGIAYDHGAFIAQSKSTETSSIIKDSPADKANLKEGDIILEVNGESVNEKHSLSGLVAKYAPGDSIKLKIARGDQEIEVDLLLEERPADIK